jgi:hypothetical protein
MKTNKNYERNVAIIIILSLVAFFAAGVFTVIATQKQQKERNHEMAIKSKLLTIESKLMKLDEGDSLIISGDPWDVLAHLEKKLKTFKQDGQTHIVSVAGLNYHFIVKEYNCYILALNSELGKPRFFNISFEATNNLFDIGSGTFMKFKRIPG